MPHMSSFPPWEYWFSEQSNKGAEPARGWRGRPKGGRVEKHDKGKEIRDLDPERQGPSGVCAGFSTITSTGSE